MAFPARSPEGEGTPSTIGVALDGLAPTARHRLLFCLIAAALFVDFFDLTMGGAIAASLLHTGWTTVTLNSMFFAAAGVGAAISVFVAGLLADRIGRVRVLQICFGLMTGGTVLCMVAPTMAFLVVARVIAAMGMGGIPTIGYVYLSEILPARVRGPWISGAGIVVAASSTVASVVAYYLLPMGMWRLMFFLPVLAGVLLMLGLHFAPESPRWLDVQGHCESAAHAFARIAARPPTYPVAAAAGRATLELSAPPAQSIDLFRPPLLRRLILGTGLAVAATVTSNSVVAWLPTLLLARSPVLQGLGDNFVIMLGAPLGSLIGYFIMARASRRRALGVSALLATTCAGACAYMDRDTGLIPAAFVLMALINLICTIILGIYLPELFPTRLRARGSSFALTVSRISLIIAPFAMAALLASYGGTGIMLSLMVCLLAILILVLVLGVETASDALRD